MLGLLLTAGLTLGARPADLVKPREKARYAAWLEGQARGAAAYYAHGADCTGAVITPQAFSKTVDAGIAKANPGVALYAERLSVQGCGEAKVQTVVVMRGLAYWKGFPMAPGESAASLELQRRVLPTVILTVKRAAQADTSCSDLDKARSALVYDTRVTRPAAGKNQPWTERWFMAVCDAGYKVDIDFTPSQDGATFAARIAPEAATGRPGLGLLGKDHGE